MRYKASQIPLILNENDILDLGPSRVTWRHGPVGRKVLVDGRFRLEASLRSGQSRLLEAGDSVYSLQAGDDVLLVERV